MLKRKYKIITQISTVLILTVFFSSALATNKLEDYTDKTIVPDWAKNAFDAMLRSDIISGNDDGTLKPNTTINRAEFAKILINATDQQLISPINPTFPDVRPEHWFYPYIETAYSLGWIKGYPDGNFRPGNSINRAEVAKLVAKSFILNVNTAGHTGNWYEPYIETLNTQGLLPFNVESNKFNAAISPTRAEVFEQIYRAIRADKNYITENQKNPGVTTTPKEDPYDIAGNFTIKMAVTDDAGTLDMKRPDYQSKRLEVTPGQKNVGAFALEMVARKSDIDLSEIQLRRIGFGEIDDFDRVWLEMNGQRITDYTTAKDDIITFKFSSTQILPENQLKVLKLFTDIASDAEPEHSHRFVLYLPNWINANTNEKIGLFPFGGSDVYIVEP